MATPVAAAPAAIPPAPSSSPTIPPAAPPAPAPAASPTGLKEVDKTQVHDLFQRLIDTSNEENPTPPAKKEPVADPAKQDPKDATPPAPAPGDPSIKVHKKPALAKRPELPKAAAEPPAAAAPKPGAAAPAAPVAPADDSDLLENEREMITQAKLVEETVGGTHKGLEQKTRQFICDHAKYLEQHPEVDDENDADAQKAYTAWVQQHRPNVTPADIARAQEERVVSRATEASTKEIEDLRHENFVIQETPKIEREAADYRASMFASALPDEIMAVINDKAHAGDMKKGAAAAQELFGEEIATAKRIIDVASADIAEFLKIGASNPKSGRGLVSAPTAAEPERLAQHQRLNTMVTQICDGFKNSATEKELVKEGRWFVTREEWHAIPPAERGRFWTFNNKEIIQRAIGGLKNTIKTAIDYNADQMKKRGYVRAPRPAAAPGNPPPPPVPGAPAPRSAPVPGATPPAGESGASAEAKSLAANLTKSD